MDGRIAMACGGLFIFIAVVVALSIGIGMWAFVTLALGGALMLIGKMMG